MDGAHRDAASEVPAPEVHLRLVVFQYLTALIRQQLFVYRDLYPWLNDPYQAPPALDGVHDRQLRSGVLNELGQQRRPNTQITAIDGRIQKLIGTAAKK